MNEQSATFLERRLGDTLDAMVAREVPTALTVPDLIESGRRRVRRRRARTTLELSATLVAALALVIGVVAGTGHQGSTPMPEPTPGPVNGAVTPSATATIGTRTDPAAPIVAFGWLPPDRNGEYEVGQTAKGLNFNVGTDPSTGQPPLTAPGDSQLQVSGPGRQLLSVFLQGPGAEIMPGTTLTPAGDVQGHQAFWGTGSPGSADAVRHTKLMLAWQYEPSAWAYIFLENADTGVANGQMMLQVARNLEIGPTNPAALPFHLAALPAGMLADDVEIDLPQQHAPQAGYAALRLCAVSACPMSGGGLLISQSSTTWTGNPTLVVNGAPQLMPGLPDPAGGVPVTVGGHEATLWTNATGATLRFTYGTAEVIIQAADDEYRALGGLDGFLAFCASPTWLGADPAHWTTHVIG